MYLHHILYRVICYINLHYSSVTADCFVMKWKPQLMTVQFNVLICHSIVSVVVSRYSGWYCIEASFWYHDNIIAWFQLVNFNQPLLPLNSRQTSATVCSCSIIQKRLAGTCCLHAAQVHHLVKGNLCFKGYYHKASTRCHNSVILNV